MTKGFVIMAVGNTVYRTCADTLTKSIYATMPHAKVSLITDVAVDSDLYDNIIVIKDVDSSEWKLANDWQIYDASPYDHTIKLEADMYIPRSIDYWWDILKDRDLNICTTIRDFRGNISTNDFYRKTFIESKLSDTYNAITYFKKSELAKRFFELVKDIFEHWDDYAQLLKYSSEDRATTDVVYAIAARIISEENCTLPTFTDFSMCHMKPAINETKSSVWHEELTYELNVDSFRINTIPQMCPVHYHNKEFALIINEELEND
jgi:hypothetical protein